MKKQSVKSKYHEHSGQERHLHGHHKPKNSKKAYERFEREEEKVSPGIHKKVEKRLSKSKGSKGKVEKVMHEFKEGALHSGSKKGPMVKNPKQAVAIALSEARKEGASIPKKSKSKHKRKHHAMIR